jgi:hypothetical protein
LLCMLDEIKAKGIVDKPDRKIIIWIAGHCTGNLWLQWHRHVCIDWNFQTMEVIVLTIVSNGR